MKTISCPFDSVRSFGKNASGEKLYYSLPVLEERGLGPVSRLPVSLRIVLESLLRNHDGRRIHADDVRRLANWNARKPADSEIPFVVARIVLQDFTGVPLLVDLAAMRAAVKTAGGKPAIIEPLVPVDLVIDHSVQVDVAGSPEAYDKNVALEFERNRERYEFLKWGQGAFKTFRVVPPSVGIVHQVNLEYLARLVFRAPAPGGEVFYPDTLVGTDSHTTMINGLGVVGWGVGGIEAEAGMLGQPVYFLTPEVVGVHLKGELREGITATDLVLTVTEVLRKEKVVGKFVEFFGPGAEKLSLADRATVANMAPEYGATMGFFPPDDKSLAYLLETGRKQEDVDDTRAYLQAQKLFGIPKPDQIDYSKVVDLDLGAIAPSVAGPKRPQDRIEVRALNLRFRELFSAPLESNGYGKSAGEFDKRLALPGKDSSAIGHGSVLIAAITSCTNTSNPSVMLAAGILAKKAAEKGLRVPAYVKTSLAPGSRVVSEYLAAAGLAASLDKLGFNLVGYGCTTCIGNSGPLTESVEAAIASGDLVTASVLSGNRNFEARVHPSIKANFLMSPPLVVAYAIAGTVDIDLQSAPLGQDRAGKPVFLKDVWPTRAELEQALGCINAKMYREKYADLANVSPAWAAIATSGGELYRWNTKSTYIQEPPFFTGFGAEPPPVPALAGMRALAILGDSVTTDHISPAGSIKKDSPAGRYLIEHGVAHADFNSYGARRGNDRVMVRGTFANVRIKNLMAGGKEGGLTRHQPSGELLAIFDAAERYRAEKVPLIVFTGVDYGMGSSRDWAAKGTALLGVRAVVAKSFERIHRSNLVGMGVLPLEFTGGQDAAALGLDGSETFAISGVGGSLSPHQSLVLEIRRVSGRTDRAQLTARIDTAIETEYYRHGGILPYVLRGLLRKT